MRKPYIVLIALTTASVALVATAQAQPPKPRCPEGRTASGECVDPGLAASNRATSIVFAQPKISYTAPPYLPIEDRGYWIARDRHEVDNLTRARSNLSIIP
jgi:hypothetical protein